MQALYLYGGARSATTRALTRNCRIRSIRSCRNPRDERTILLIRRHASSTSAAKPASKPLPYKPRPSVAEANSRAQKQGRELPPRQQQQQQQQGKKGGSRKQPIGDLVRDRWFAILGYGSALGCLGYFTASTAMYWRREPAPCYPVGREPEAPTGRPSVQSPYEFDLHLDKSEWRYGITTLRRKLGDRVRGHVLEVAIGTGRNLEFYDWDAVTESLLTPEERRDRAKASAGWFSGGGASSSGRGFNKAAQKDDGAILSFTGVDISPGMLDITLQRMRQIIPHMTDEIPKKPSFAILAAKSGQGERPEGHLVSFISDRIRLLQSDVQSALPAPPALPPADAAAAAAGSSESPDKYDTIVQTFGLCSVRDPVSLVSLMASSLRPGTGRILLLEHGRSVWDLVNGLLDRGARGHHERFGCWWNRDIEAIVSEAARQVPGLEIVRLRRPGWVTVGTHVVVELRVRDDSPPKVEGPPRKPRKVTGWPSLFQSFSLFSAGPAGDSTKKD
ncbi:putative ubiquinone menaquinone biosynthesis-related protein [Rosellinia necatrix]|uniref:Putative ubiquinone menaquinone biosynthesis-related protein n=1 Tax=Rosellinia necatrix TaxID=77044 RepID=A0A1W2TRZ6_ROSNE|nr:putative ubiquinone menaquinone biosynthesis-related protein [Rosellinia necatrix]